MNMDPSNNKRRHILPQVMAMAPITLMLMRGQQSYQDVLVKITRILTS